jgi:hypothetical protein
VVHGAPDLASLGHHLPAHAPKPHVSEVSLNRENWIQKLPSDRARAGTKSTRSQKYKVHVRSYGWGMTGPSTQPNSVTNQ